MFICVIGLIALLLFFGWAEAEPAKALEKIKAKPDVIIMTGDAFAVQKVLSIQIKNYPDLAAVPAIRNQAIYSLPFYADSSVIEYPAILRQWTVALAD